MQTDINFALSSLPLPVRLRPGTPMNDLELMRFSRENRPLRMEREENGDILIMTPTGSRTGDMNHKIGMILGLWAEEDGRGVTFDSSTGFRLPNGAVRSPDASWLVNERWDAMTSEEQDGFGVCPDFIIELTLPSDRLPQVKKKIVEQWLPSGVSLVWLIDTESRTVAIFRPGEEPELLHDPSSVQGTGLVSGFELVMARIWG
ncbi:Uma2 family endonuclease [Granulicella tundricola]|uniref:Uma2 family endonuclease n=1 Tax=Granulicella tundricola TaxID=940615 RepID=UPI0012F738C0|nr:Uma2 family endonuclease [Granulicella tundricola]